MQAWQTITVAVTQTIFAIPAVICVILLFGAGGGMIAGFHPKPSDHRAVKYWKKVCRAAAVPILLCLALIDASVICFVLGHNLAGGLLIGAGAAEAVIFVLVFNCSKYFSAMIAMSKDEYWEKQG